LPAEAAVAGRLIVQRVQPSDCSAAFLLALFGAVAFVGGAATGAWPVWATGMLAVGASVVVYRP
jgi:transcriptional regulator GlxA family with amidase domain